MTEIELHQPTTALTEQMDYARAVSTAALLPQAYRGKPADIMLAVGLGSAMGLTPAESLYRIDVIQGKPTASAELIAANVRKAGHKLRVRIDEKAVSATATIIRADDPEFEHTVTRDRAWAKEMGLLGKDNYKKQPTTMLQWRAITAVARLACPEALYGVAYTADEMYDDGQRSAAPAGGLAAAMAGTTMTAQQVVEQPAAPEEPEQPADESPLLDPKSDLAKAMFATFYEVGIIEPEGRLQYVTDVIGREVTTSREMTDQDARDVIDALKADLDQPFPEVEK